MEKIWKVLEKLTLAKYFVIVDDGKILESFRTTDTLEIFRNFERWKCVKDAEDVQSAKIWKTRKMQKIWKTRKIWKMHICAELTLAKYQDAEDVESAATKPPQLTRPDPYDF